MKILVTGASGFIGGRFARFALEQGLDVRVNGRRAEGVEHLVRRGAEFVQGDLSDPELARELCSDVEAMSSALRADLSVKLQAAREQPAHHI